MQSNQSGQIDIQGIKDDAEEFMCGTARSQCWQALADIAENIQPGMSEKEAIKMANVLLASRGVRKFWHKTHIRMGQSTVLSFNDDYREDVILGEDDIFYLDLGPVWDGVESDCGRTYVVGSDPEKVKIIQDVETLFKSIKNYWNEFSPRGPEMLDFAQKETERMGYLLHPSYVKGHRLSEFSHSLYGKSSIYDLNTPPLSKRWVLEIQICHPDMKYGAFFEDLLI